MPAAGSTSIKTVGIVGGGVIGSGWAARCLAHGLDVIATDPAPNAEKAMRDSVARLSEAIGAQVDVASIPGGFYSPAVAASAFDSGIRYLFTSEPTTRVVRRGEAWLIGRYALQRGMGPDAAAAFAQGTGIARQRQWLLWNLKKPAKRWAGPAYRWLRRRSFGGS